MIKYKKNLELVIFNWQNIEVKVNDVISGNVELLKRFENMKEKLIVVWYYTYNNKWSYIKVKKVIKKEKSSKST